MADLTGAIHVKLAELLIAHAGLAALVAGRIYDTGAVPVTPAFPHVVIGPYNSADAGDKGDGANDSGDGVDFAQTIDIWDRSPDAGVGRRGKKRAELVMAEIHDALHRLDAELGGSPPVGSIVVQRVNNIQTFLDADGLTIHGVMRVEGFASSA